MRAVRGEDRDGGADVSDVAWRSPSCHVAGGGQVGGRLDREEEEEMRGCSEREEMRGVPELWAKAYLVPGVGTSWGRSRR